MILTSLHGMEMVIHIFSYHWLLTQLPFCEGNDFLQDNGENGGKGTVYKFVLFPIIQMFAILYVVIAVLLYSSTICSYLLIFVFFNLIVWIRVLFVIM